MMGVLAKRIIMHGAMNHESGADITKATTAGTAPITMTAELKAVSGPNRSLSGESPAVLNKTTSVPATPFRDTQERLGVWHVVARWELNLRNLTWRTAITTKPPNFTKTLQSLTAPPLINTARAITQRAWSILRVLSNILRAQASKVIRPTRKANSRSK
jgi:hypothetical protein